MNKSVCHTVRCSGVISNRTVHFLQHTSYSTKLYHNLGRKKKKSNSFSWKWTLSFLVNLELATLWGETRAGSFSGCWRSSANEYIYYTRSFDFNIRTRAIANKQLKIQLIRRAILLPHSWNTLPLSAPPTACINLQCRWDISVRVSQIILVPVPCTAVTSSEV